MAIRNGASILEHEGNQGNVSIVSSILVSIVASSVGSSVTHTATGVNRPHLPVIIRLPINFEVDQDDCSKVISILMAEN